ncbi:hypothetical protein BOTBODRAFT_225605 [Botryobasidium botryosum FD-172 SS1]|uniref:Uncharacterized protein n=1 Tax=Botryobasidium botryosum (strain FD-172 SS1) TaxID=930990 RepID=A0A067MMY0_BOTB1|nr:hypothetical protein BOTBODRAFT_225605 [Botryobasidium botryosum FD-172 SS1]
MSPSHWEDEFTRIGPSFQCQFCNTGVLPRSKAQRHATSSLHRRSLQSAALPHKKSPHALFSSELPYGVAAPTTNHPYSLFDTTREAGPSVNSRRGDALPTPTSHTHPLCVPNESEQDLQFSETNMAQSPLGADNLQESTNNVDAADYSSGKPLEEYMKGLEEPELFLPADRSGEAGIFFTGEVEDDEDIGALLFDSDAEAEDVSEESGR